MIRSALCTLFFAALLAPATCQKSIQKRVLVTGFLPFNQYPINPSGDVSRLLNGTCSVLPIGNVCFDGLVLPVNVTGSSLVSLMIEDAVKGGRDFAWDAVLHMGLEDVAKGLKIETFALNQAVPDNATFGMHYLTASCLNNSDYDQPTAAPAVAGAPCELPTTVDLGRLVLDEALRATTVSAAQRSAFLLEAWSRNAGTYYCNGAAKHSSKCFSASLISFSETLFRTLEAIRRLKLSTRSGRLLPAMFVHLPAYEALPRQDMIRLIQALGAQMAMMQ